MGVLDGLLFINDLDVYVAYGAFLCEDRQGANNNYSALLKPPAMKPYVAVNFRELDGEKLPEELLTAYEPREVALQFMILAPSREDFIERWEAFLAMLSSGWLKLRVPELERTFRMYYMSCTEYKQLTKLNADTVAGKFKIKFREPVPFSRGISHEDGTEEKIDNEVEDIRL